MNILENILNYLVLKFSKYLILTSLYWISCFFLSLSVLEDHHLSDIEKIIEKELVKLFDLHTYVQKLSLFNLVRYITQDIKTIHIF